MGHNLLQDVTYGMRQLRKNFIFTLTAVVTLGIGIGANTTLFTIARALLFRDPVGVAAPERLIDIGFTYKGRGFGAGSYPNYLDIASRATTLDGVYAHPRFAQPMSFENERVFGFEVSSNYFTVLGAVPRLGRLLAPGDSDSVVLSHRFWTRRFHEDSSIIGKSIRLNDKPLTVVGVAADGFQGTGIRAADVWLPLRESENRGAAFLVLGARLRPSVSLSQAAAELAVIGRALQQEYPADNKDRSIVVAALSPVPGETAPVAAFLGLLAAIATLVLAIACANIAGVLLAQGAERRREIAVRLAIGASRGRIAAQLLTETLLLFAIGATVGLALAAALPSLVVSQLPNLPFPVHVSPRLDLQALIFVTTLSFFAAMLCGLMPAWHATKHDLVSALKESQRMFARLRLRHVFVIAQVSLSVLLFVIAGLFARALQFAVTHDPGFDTKGVELATIDPEMSHQDSTTAPLFLRSIADRVRALPDVEAATVAAVFPGGFEGIGLGGLSSEGVPADWNIVEPGYFATLHMSLIAGRDFNADDRKGSPDVVILGEGAARRFWPTENAVGKSIEQRQFTRNGTQRRMLTVVGVVRDPKFGSLIDGTTGVFAYVPLQQQYLAGWRPIIAARSKSANRLSGQIRDVLTTVAPGTPILMSQTADDYASLGLVPQRVVGTLSGTLAMIGLVLAGIGIYGVTSYMVRRRSREIGIRVALGATPSNIVGMVLTQGLWLVGTGTVIGLVLAAGAGQVLSSLLFGIPALDPLVFVSAAAIFILTGLLACYVPSHRATQIHPIDTTL